MLLQFLVTSKTRRLLLSLLWGEERRGTATELAEHAGVSVAGAHGELKEMEQSRLVVVRRVDGRDVYAANLDHPEAATLRALLASSTPTQLPVAAEDDALKGALVTLGAPLRGPTRRDVAPSARMRTLVEGARLARRDPTVARSLPLCFWKLRTDLDAKALAELAARAEDKHAVGFFVELAGELGGDRRLGGLAESLRDRRMTSVRQFFQTGRRDTPREFPLAATWGFQMNMDLDAFRTLFDKFAKR